MIAATAAVASFSGHRCCAAAHRTAAHRTAARHARATTHPDAGTFLSRRNHRGRRLQQQLQQLTPASALVLYAAGLLTSLTPLPAMLPLTIGFIGGLEEEAAATADCCTTGGAAPAAAGAAAAAAAPAVGGSMLVPAAAFAAALVRAHRSRRRRVVVRRAVRLGGRRRARERAAGGPLRSSSAGWASTCQGLPFELPSLALDNVPGARPRPRHAPSSASTALVSSPVRDAGARVDPAAAGDGRPRARRRAAARVHARVHDARSSRPASAIGSAKKFAAMRSSFEWVRRRPWLAAPRLGTYQTLVGLFGAV